MTCLGIHATEERRHLFDDAITLPQFSMLRHLEVPLHFLDSACSTSWLALATPNLETLIIAPCHIYAPNGLYIDGEEHFDSCDQLITDELDNWGGEPLFRTKLREYSNPHDCDREKQLEVELLGIHKRGWGGRRNYKILLNVQIEIRLEVSQMQEMVSLIACHIFRNSCWHPPEGCLRRGH
jgi:hypothetical protein